MHECKGGDNVANDCKALKAALIYGPNGSTEHLGIVRALGNPDHTFLLAVLPLLSMERWHRNHYSGSIPSEEPHMQGRSASGWVN